MGTARPAPVVWTVPWEALLSPRTVPKVTVAVLLTPEDVATVRATTAGSAPGCTGTCQSSATLDAARLVMVAFDDARNVPREASRATAAPTPAVTASRRAGR